MQWISCAAAIILFSFVPSLHGVLSRIVGSSGAYGLGTLLMLGLVAAMPAVWPQPTSPRDDVRPRTFVTLTIVLAGIGLLAVVAFKLLATVFTGPLDPNRGDMLVIIEHAIRLFLEGGNPYSIHKVPWDAPLSYGPVLWIPFVVPHLLLLRVRHPVQRGQVTERRDDQARVGGGEPEGLQGGRRAARQLGSDLVALGLAPPPDIPAGLRRPS